VLITAVLIVAIIAGVAASLGLGQQVWLRQTENLIERAQADSLRRSALDWVAILLRRDADDNKLDHLDEAWAKQLPPLPTEGGMIAVSIRDAQGLFNLNNLVRNGAPSPADIGVFQRLLTAQGIDPALTEALIDWLDADSNTRPGGGEDIDYLAQQPPYRVANQPLTSVDELRLVRGFTPQIVEKLRPLVTVLPGPSEINVNTATEPVLTALLPVSASGAAATILRARKDQPFKDNGEFQRQLPPGTTLDAAYGIKTGYFLVTIGIRFGRLDRRSESLIARPYGQPASVLWHRLNPVVPDLKADERT
jgi:general secretion pathway protein K